MTKNDIMEELSKGFIEVIAHSRGYYNLYGRDYGTDLHIRQARGRSENGRNRYLNSGRGVDVQLKAVTEKYVRITPSHLKYSLESKNFNDLVERVNEAGAYIPLVLIVFIFPDDFNSWIEVSASELIVRKCAYWYTIDSSVKPTTNESSVTIEIPKENLVSLDLFPSLFKKFT